MATASRSAFEGNSAVTITGGAAMLEVAAEYHQSTFKGTPTCNIHSGTALYET